jgi:hypothetical protein
MLMERLNLPSTRQNQYAWTIYATQRIGFDILATSVQKRRMPLLLSGLKIRHEFERLALMTSSLVGGLK